VTIYFALHPQERWIKIGYTRGPAAIRVSKLPHGVHRLLHSAPAGREEEKRWHRRHAALRVRVHLFAGDRGSLTEYFRAAKALLDDLAPLLDEASLRALQAWQHRVVYRMHVVRGRP
jgi:hypothetical protein